MSKNVGIHPNYTLSEMKAARPVFFSNAEGPEQYNIRMNHLIVTRLDTGKVSVWQFNFFISSGEPSLKPIFRTTKLTTTQVIKLTEDRLASGEWPIYTGPVARIGNIEEWDEGSSDE